MWLLGHVVHVDEDEIRPLNVNLVRTNFSVCVP